ncbi:MAG: aspartate aminotransferase [Candidatus Marinamargulisbacteria bacterium]|jgi:aspartate aminotransferase
MASRVTDIRSSLIAFQARPDKVIGIGASIGNVRLPIHPAILKQHKLSFGSASPLENGIYAYSPTKGFPDTIATFKHIIHASGFDTDRLDCVVTDGGSQAMDLVILGCCGEAGSGEKPLLLFDPAYTNYGTLANQYGRNIVTLSRNLESDGKFSMPTLKEVETRLLADRPGALVVIPYDNPTGSLFSKDYLIGLGKLAVKHNIWMVSDEAYRELSYQSTETVSIWGLTDETVPGIEGRRISIETASKVWNACGLRIGALVSDNPKFIQKAVAIKSPKLCSSVEGQWMFQGLLSESKQDLQSWFKHQRNHYATLMTPVIEEFSEIVPDLIVSKPEAAIYSVLDVRNFPGLPPQFDARDFAMFCAESGSVPLASSNGQVLRHTLLVAPMSGFYGRLPGRPNPGRTQIRISFVESPEKLALIPALFKQLLEDFIKM